MRWLEATDRCPDHPDAFGAEHLVEAGTELGVPIPNEELDRSTAVYQITDQVAGYLGDDGTVRMVGAAEGGALPESTVRSQMACRAA
jgi:hypothetical protein